MLLPKKLKSYLTSCVHACFMITSSFNNGGNLLAEVSGLPTSEMEKQKEAVIQIGNVRVERLQQAERRIERVTVSRKLLGGSHAVVDCGILQGDG